MRRKNIQRSLFTCLLLLLVDCATVAAFATGRFNTPAPLYQLSIGCDCGHKADVAAGFVTNNLPAIPKRSTNHIAEAAGHVTITQFDFESGANNQFNYSAGVKTIETAAND